MSDLVLAMNLTPDAVPTFDLSVLSGLPDAEAELLSAIIISLFTDRLAEVDDIIPAGDGDRRGWWPDTFEQDSDQIGSRLWLLWREKQQTPVLRRAEEYAQEALQWLLDDGVASRVEIVATNPKTSWLQLDIAITKPSGETNQYDFIWEALNGV